MNRGNNAHAGGTYTGLPAKEPGGSSTQPFDPIEWEGAERQAVEDDWENGTWGEGFDYDPDQQPSGGGRRRKTGPDKFETFAAQQAAKGGEEHSAQGVVPKVEEETEVVATPQALEAQATVDYNNANVEPGAYANQKKKKKSQEEENEHANEIAVAPGAAPIQQAAPQTFKHAAEQHQQEHPETQEFDMPEDYSDILMGPYDHQRAEDVAYTEDGIPFDIDTGEAVEVPEEELVDLEDSVPLEEESVEQTDEPDYRSKDFPRGMGYLQMWGGSSRYVDSPTAKNIIKEPERMNDLLSKSRARASKVDEALALIGLDVEGANEWADTMLTPGSTHGSISEESRRRAVEQQFIREYYSGDLNIRGQHLVKRDGVFMTQYSPETEYTLGLIAKTFGLDPVTDHTAITQLIRQVLGYGVDRDLRVWKSDDTKEHKSNMQVAPEFIHIAWNLMQASIQETGHPFAFTYANLDAANIYGGHPRFGVGIVPVDLAIKLCRSKESVLHDFNPFDVVEASRRSTETTYKYLSQWAYNNQREDVVKSWEDMARALCRVNGIKPEIIGISSMGPANFATIYRENGRFRDQMHRINPEAAELVGDYDLSLAEQQLFSRTNLAQRRAQQRRDALTKSGTDTARLSDEIAGFGLNAWRTVHIAGNVPLMATSVAEQGKGLFEVSLANRAFLAGKDNPYKLPSDAFSDFDHKKELLDAMNAFQLLIQADSGRRDLLLSFCATGAPMTTKAVDKFLSDMAPSANSKTIDEARRRLQKVSDAIMVGDFATAWPFAKNFMTSFMVEQQAVNGLPGDLFSEALRTNPIEVMTQIATSDEAWNAYHRTTNTTYKRVSPLTVTAKSLLADRGALADLVSTVVLNAPYFNYALQVMEAWLPFSNTAEYLITYAVTNRAENTGKLSAEERRAIMESSIGGLTGLDRGFIEGLKLCMQYDAMRFGSTALQALFHLAVITWLCGGVQPPDDDDDPYVDELRKNDYRFYKVTNPFTGESEPIMESWFLDDLTQWSIPAAIGIQVGKQTGDWIKAANICINGGLDMLGSNKCLQGLEVLANTGKDVFRSMTTGTPLPSFKFDLAKECEDRLLKLFSDPMAISQFHDLMHEGDLERDRYKKITGESRNEREAQLNQFALNNDLFGWVLNRFTNGDYGWEGSALRTEHDAEDEAAAKANSFETYMSANPEGTMAGYYEYVKGVIDYYGSTADAAANGIRISKKDAYLLSNYLNELNSEQIKRLNEAAVNDTELYYQIKDSVWALVSLNNSFKSDLYYDNLIFDKDQYNVLYNSKVKLRGKDGEDVWVDYGDNPSEGFLWNSPSPGSHDTDNDGNKEHNFRDVFISPTDVDGNYGDYRTEKYTNDGRTADGRKWIPKNTQYGNITQAQWQKLREDGYTEAEIKKMSGGNGPADLSDEQIAELAKLGYLSDEYQNLPFADQCKVDAQIMKDAKAAAAEKAAASKSTSNSSRYSYKSGGGGGGGGGSSYSPRIYSMKAGSLNVNKPAAMYTKSPYSANRNYLSPNVTTKGSREAYQRSEY